MLRILLADDHELTRSGLRYLLEKQDGWTVCGEASNGRMTVEIAEKLKPDFAILDMSMPELNGLEATRQILKNHPQTNILIYTMHETDKDNRRCSGSRSARRGPEVGRRRKHGCGRR